MNTPEEFKAYIQELSDKELLVVLDTIQEFKEVVNKQQELLIEEIEERGQRLATTSPLLFKKGPNA
jgi:hypothetical protein